MPPSTMPATASDFRNPAARGHPQDAVMPLDQAHFGWKWFLSNVTTEHLGDVGEASNLPGSALTLLRSRCLAASA